MFPSQAANFNIEAVSGICGSISIACWVVVFSPQIIENFRRGSADGLSLLFLIVWLAGDVFNILGAVLQGVLPTMIILAVYYTLADIVLLGQCFYYRGFNITEELSSSSPAPESSTPAATGALNATDGSGSDGAATPTERSALLPKSNGHVDITGHGHGEHPSTARTYPPATPFIEPTQDSIRGTRSPQARRRISTLQAIFFNITAIALVCTAGVLGWYVSPGSKTSTTPDPLILDPLGQVFGYLCAVLYLGSRVPQLLLNFRRKSTDGVSLLFFLFACIGNLTYVLSILAYVPVCPSAAVLSEQSHRLHARCRPGEAAALYGRYILVNLSWLVGSLGTLLLDMAIFVQFFLYRDGKGDETDEEDEGR
ncbi:hypothetical protein NUU61_002077 [Penicillium alfredii]|uniref:PQ-loop-domain-containing protein n=1 Tax=Penicillium alfredii TaxID=1506179 RepID=A0A9W9KFN7_9EURO|nr:uncharacterized protein NUU61_002077 [Penicillium alfredii]KAJ5104730.1 hypothetical protein NUU61_002077 [Penicillium alfredii]